MSDFWESLMQTVTARRDKEAGYALDMVIFHLGFEVWVRVCKVLIYFPCFLQPTVISTTVLFILCPQFREVGPKVDWQCLPEFSIETLESGLEFTYSHYMFM